MSPTQPDEATLEEGNPARSSDRRSGSDGGVLTLEPVICVARARTRTSAEMIRDFQNRLRRFNISSSSDG